MLGKYDVPNKKVFKICKSETPSSSLHIEWTKQLDNTLKQIVAAHEGKNWKGIAAEMQTQFNNPYITAKRCRERWTCRVNPAIKKGPLTDAEVLLLLIYHQQLHNNWSQLSKVIPHRYNNTLKNNFYSLVRSIIRKILIGDFERITGFYLLEAIYVSSVVAELLKQPEECKYGKGDMPPHICALIAEKGITQGMCEGYLRKVIEHLIVKYPERVVMKHLQEHNTLSKLEKLFVAVGSRIETEVRDLPGSLKDLEITDLVEELILKALEKELGPAMATLSAVFPYTNPLTNFKGSSYMYPFAADALPTVSPSFVLSPRPHFTGNGRPLSPSEHNYFVASSYYKK